MNTGLSKSKYVTFCTCPKALWLRTYKPELEVKDTGVESRFEIGNEVGDLTNEFTYFKYDSHCDSIVEHGMEGRYGLNYCVDMLYYFEYYSGDYDDKSLFLKEMSEVCKNNKLDKPILIRLITL